MDVLSYTLPQYSMKRYLHESDHNKVPHYFKDLIIEAILQKDTNLLFLILKYEGEDIVRHDQMPFLWNKYNISRKKFQRKREEYYFNVRCEVKHIGRFIAANFRKTLYYKTLIDIPQFKIIPEFIIMLIVRLTYDPITYSYLSE